ncbi:uncharacterized protein TEOVI_000316000 [Trypanosoma equiperdum]|uniref:Uncharacterized protein n=3 Tax=Trypanozoon TaxID=39700 RepID=Q4GZC5_TRYB2|nr:hypothetical protein, unlikely [Trypanosoma brucei brucei TREU927]RHW70031.1 hypothetical protein DPX39_090010200 [Trypanosoma brucei equiperdum]CAJ16016.1 hypothetical protein, unlikely [Trypanosoma brucei brucei TREU927]SCU71579.1 hypothetical protein, conserved [Trypanosoma equiperdum]
MGLAKMENETDASASNIERKRPAAQRRTSLYGGARLQRCQEKRYKMSISNKNGLKRQRPSLVQCFQAATAGFGNRTTRQHHSTHQLVMACATMPSKRYKHVLRVYRRVKTLLE